jgi:hypothetical protein
MYLAGTLYRIHGTSDPSSIGKRVSSGCIRMLNEDAIDLYNRTPVGTKVVVVPDSGRRVASYSAANERLTRAQRVNAAPVAPMPAVPLYGEAPQLIQPGAPSPSGLY